MRVVERFFMGKHPDQGLCEDVVVVTDAHTAVFDGAGEMGLGPKDMTGARFAATMLAEALAGLPSESSFPKAAEFLSAALDERMRHAIGPLSPAQRPSAVAVIYSAPRREIWRVGDPHFGVDGVASLGSLSSGVAAAGFRALYLSLLLLSGEATIASLIEHDPTRGVQAPILRDFHLLRNSDAGTGWEFGAFDGTPIPSRFLEVTPLPVGASEVVLTSDARVLAVVGLLLGLIGLLWSIGWAVFTWRGSGPRVALEAEYFLFIDPGVRKAQCLNLTCRNRGRSAIGSSGLDVELVKPPRGLTADLKPLLLPQGEDSHPVPESKPPRTLAAGHAANWVTEVTVDEYPKSFENQKLLIRPVLELGSGKRVKAQLIEVWSGPMGLD